MTEQKEILERISNLAFDIQHTDTLQVAFDKAQAIQNLVQGQQTFKVGEYYVAEIQGIYKIGDYNQDRGLYTVDCFYPEKKIFGKAHVWHKDYFGKDRKATTEEIALFKRAEHFHSKGRKLNEFKQGDIVKERNENGLVVEVRKHEQIIVQYPNELLQVAYYKFVHESLNLIMTAEELEAVAQEGKG